MTSSPSITRGNGSRSGRAVALVVIGLGVVAGLITLIYWTTHWMHYRPAPNQPGTVPGTVNPGGPSTAGGTSGANDRTVAERFNMLLFEGELMYRDMEGGEFVMKDAYQLLPGLGVLLGGMWVANLFYWGCNQYIIQRALAAKSLKEARRGLVFAAYLKLLLPLVVVIPGIVAYALDAPIVRGDEAYPWLLGTYLGPGLKGLAFAALVAAIVSSLASMMNSTSTIFTMDLYKTMIQPDAPEHKLVNVGRLVSLICIVIAAIVAPQLASLDQAFQYIQEYTGFISPGVLAIFVMGLFWKKSTPKAALVSALLSIPLSAGLKFLAPFLNRMGYVFLISVALIVVISLIENKGRDHERAVSLAGTRVEPDAVFTVAAFGILGLTAALYAMFW